LELLRELLQQMSLGIRPRRAEGGTATSHLLGILGRPCEGRA
jgi:hypothetical protein